VKEKKQKIPKNFKEGKNQAINKINKQAPINKYIPWQDVSQS